MEGFYIEVIGSRSFSSVWYWIVCAVVWTRTTHWTLGVPYEDARLARKLGGQHRIDFELMMDVNVRKTVALYDGYSVFLTALGAFAITMIFMLGFHFNIQFMQAGFLVLFPLTVVGLLTFQLAMRLHKDPLTGDALFKAYVWHRRVKQVIGALSIFFTAFWGVSQTLFTPYA